MPITYAASPFAGDSRLTAVGDKTRRYLRHFTTIQSVANRRHFRFCPPTEVGGYENEAY
jgi:hypothetical protein